MTERLLTTDAKSRVRLSRSVESGQLKRVARGIYSENQQYDMLEVYSLRYPNAIFTLDTMFSIYGMTDRFIDRYVLSMLRGSRTISDSKIRQIRQESSIWSIGLTQTTHRDILIRCYDRERLLIELFRFANSISKTLYKEVIRHYRETVHDGFRISVFHEYCTHFREHQGLKEHFAKEIL